MMELPEGWSSSEIVILQFSYRVVHCFPSSLRSNKRRLEALCFYSTFSFCLTHWEFKILHFLPEMAEKKIDKRKRFHNLYMNQKMDALIQTGKQHSRPWWWWWWNCLREICFWVIRWCYPSWIVSNSRMAAWTTYF